MIIVPRLLLLPAYRNRCEHGLRLMPGTVCEVMILSSEMKLDLHGVVCGVPTNHLRVWMAH